MSKKTKEIRKRFEIAEEKKGRPLTKKEKRSIEKKVQKKYRRENIKRGILVALGITAGVGGHALLTSGDKVQDNARNQKNESQLNNKDEFKEGLKVEETPSVKKQEKQVDYDQVLNEIIDAYNEKYDTNLIEDNIKYIKSSPQYLGISDDGTYIQDYLQSTPVNEYKYDHIEDIYIMINGQDNKIIGSLGEIDNRVQNVDTKIVMDRKSNTYYESDKKINLTENGNLKQVQDRYDALKNAYEKEIEQEKEDER